MHSLDKTLLAFALLNSIFQGQICLLLQVFLAFLLLHSSPLSVAGYPMSKVRGRSREDPMPEGQQPRGVTPRLRSGAAAEASYPTSKERWQSWRRRAERSYSTFKVRKGSGEEIPLVQGKKQRLHFA